MKECRRVCIACAEGCGRKFLRKLEQRLGVAMAGEADEFEMIRQGPQHTHRALADGAGGTENDNFFLHQRRKKRRRK